MFAAPGQFTGVDEITRQEAFNVKFSTPVVVVLSVYVPSELAVHVPVTSRDPLIGTDPQAIPISETFNCPVTLRQDEVAFQVPTMSPPQAETLVHADVLACSEAPPLPELAPTPGDPPLPVAPPPVFPPLPVAPPCALAPPLLFVPPVDPETELLVVQPETQSDAAIKARVKNRTLLVIIEDQPFCRHETLRGWGGDHSTHFVCTSPTSLVKEIRCGFRSMLACGPSRLAAATSPRVRLFDGALVAAAGELGAAFEAKRPSAHSA